MFSVRGVAAWFLTQLARALLGSVILGAAICAVVLYLC